MILQKAFFALSALCSLLISFTAAPAWGATGYVNVPAESMETFKDFTVTAAYRLTSDDTPTGTSYCGGPLTPYVNYYGSHGSAAILWVLVDAAPVYRVDLRGHDFEPHSITWPISIGNYALNSTHSVEFRLEAVSR